MSDYKTRTKNNLDPCFLFGGVIWIKAYLKMQKKEAGCEYISDLKYLDKWIVPAFKKMKWNEYRAEDIKRLMCYLYGE